MSRFASIDSPRRARRAQHFPTAGALAGAIGGVAGGFFKLGWEVPFPPRPPDRLPEPLVLVGLFTHRPAPEFVSWIVHFAFSILAGAAYGAIVEFAPVAAIGMGTGFGIFIWIGAHEIVMPMMGLTPATWKLPITEQLSEFFGHAGWGFVLEAFRRDFRTRFTAQRSEAMLGTRR